MHYVNLAVNLEAPTVPLTPLHCVALAMQFAPKVLEL